MESFSRLPVAGRSAMLASPSGKMGGPVLLAGGGRARPPDPVTKILYALLRPGDERRLEKSDAFTLMTALTVASLPSPPHTPVGMCVGHVQVGKEWTTVKREFGDYAPEGCRFQTASELGRRIIAACPDTSVCVIDVPLTKRSSALAGITNVERLPPLKELAKITRTRPRTADRPTSRKLPPQCAPPTSAAYRPVIAEKSLEAQLWCIFERELAITQKKTAPGTYTGAVRLP